MLRIYHYYCCDFITIFWHCQYHYHSNYVGSLPEFNRCTLEYINLLFASNSLWVWDAEKNFARPVSEKPEMSHAAFVRGGIARTED